MVSLLVLVWGCAHFKAVPKGSEDALRKLVSLEWKAKMNNDWGTVYDLTSSTFRSKISREEFVRRCNLVVKSFRIVDVVIAEAGRKAEVVVAFDTIVMGKLLKGVRLKEKWVWENGKWRLNLACIKANPLEVGRSHHQHLPVKGK